PVSAGGAHSKAQGTEGDPVPVEQEPHHKLVFENQYIKVLRVAVKPGETTLFHTHSLDNVAVVLSNASMRNQFAGKDWVEAPAKEGAVRLSPGTSKPYTHRISNVGSSTFHVFDIEVLP